MRGARRQFGSTIGRGTSGPMLHSPLSRVSAIFTFFTSVLGLLVAAIALQSTFYRFEGAVQLSTDNPVVFRWNKFEMGRFAFDLEANLTGEWNWNTKHLYLWLMAEYSTPRFPRNGVTLWDTVLRSPGQSVVSLHNQQLKYRFLDRQDGLSGTNVTLAVRYAVCPHSGYMAIKAPLGGQLSRVLPASVPAPVAASPPQPQQPGYAGPMTRFGLPAAYVGRGSI